MIGLTREQISFAIWLPLLELWIAREVLIHEKARAILWLNMFDFCVIQAFGFMPGKGLRFMNEFDEGWL